MIINRYTVFTSKFIIKRCLENIIVRCFVLVDYLKDCGIQMLISAISNPDTLLTFVNGADACRALFM
jgi:hypothetical protein